jgi:hypothetical protein
MTGSPKAATYFAPRPSRDVICSDFNIETGYSRKKGDKLVPFLSVLESRVAAGG